MSDVLASAESYNPLQGVSPDISVFGVDFSNAVNLVLGAVWGLVMIYITFRLLVAIGRWAYHSLRTRDEEAIEEGAGGIKKALAAFLLGLLAGVILTVLINIAQTLF